MATRQELDMRKAKRIVKRIALRFDISPEMEKEKLKLCRNTRW